MYSVSASAWLPLQRRVDDEDARAVPCGKPRRQYRGRIDAEKKEKKKRKKERRGHQRSQPPTALRLPARRLGLRSPYSDAVGNLHRAKCFISHSSRTRQWTGKTNQNGIGLPIFERKKKNKGGTESRHQRRGDNLARERALTRQGPRWLCCRR